MEKERLWDHICREVGSSGIDLIRLYLDGGVLIGRIAEEFGGSTADLVEDFEKLAIAEALERGD